MADDLDVLTLDEAKATVDIAETDSSEDERLAACVTAVSRLLAEKVGPIVKVPVADELHNGRGCSVWLRHHPVAEVTTVTEYDAGVPAVLPAEAPDDLVDGYLAEPSPNEPGLLTGQLIRRNNGRDAAWPWGRLNVKVTYVAGRYESTEDVDPLYKDAARIMLRNEWRAYEQSVTTSGEYDVPAQSFPKFGVPNAARDLLAHVWQHRAALAGFA